MRVRLGVDYARNDALAVAAAVLDNDGEIETVVNIKKEAAENGKVTERGMLSAALMAGVDGLRSLGVPRDEIMRLAENTYTEGAKA